MPTTITLPEPLAVKLQAEAAHQHLPLEELIVDILAGALAQPEHWPYPKPASDEEPIPKPPPPTPEGDRVALAALDALHGLFPITDPEVGRWVAESEEAALYNAFLYHEGSTE